MGCACRKQPEEDGGSSQERPPTNVQAKIQKLKTAVSKAGDDDPVFINSMIALVWPFATAFALDICRKELPPAINAQLPKSIGQFQLTPNEDAVGHDAVKLYQMSGKMEEQMIADSKGNMNPSKNLVVSMTVAWDANCCIDFTVGGISLQVTKLVFTGDLTIKLIHMNSQKIPLFDGMRAFFANPPECTFNIEKGNIGGRRSQMLGKVLNNGIVKKTILDVALKVIGDLMVLPNRMGISLDPSVDVFDIKQPSPEGLLRLTVWRAENIIGSDTHLFSENTSDPYVQIRCGCLVFKSAHQKGTCSPIFNYHIPLIICGSQQQKVIMELYDYDFGTRDDFLGRIEVPVLDLMGMEGEDHDFDIKDINGEAGKNGTMRITANWAKSHLDPAKAHIHDMCMVSVGIYNAQHVRCSENTRAWVEVKVSNCMAGRPGGNKDSTFHHLEKMTHVEKDDEHKKMKHKIEILRKRGSPDKEIAEVLELDIDRLKEIDRMDHDHEEKKHHTRFHPRVFEWNQAFDFLLASADGATVTLELKTEGLVPKPAEVGNRNTKGLEKKILSHGRHKVKLNTFKKDPVKKMVETITFDKHEKLKFRLKLLFFETPVRSTSEDWIKMVNASPQHESWNAGDTGLDGDVDEFLKKSDWSAKHTHTTPGAETPDLEAGVLPSSPTPTSYQSAPAAAHHDKGSSDAKAKHKKHKSLPKNDYKHNDVRLPGGQSKPLMHDRT